jgi:hypothetical protein
MNSSSKIKKVSLASQLAKDFGQFNFISGKTAMWSPKDNSITYVTKSTKKSDWTLLHELAHGLLGHNTYSTDFELLKMESQAWQKAKEIGKKYKVVIDDEHIQNCLDTYRDWLHRRSTCPTCGLRSPQINSSTYHCINCKTQWKVTADRFVRPYRLKT